MSRISRQFKGPIRSPLSHQPQQIMNLLVTLPALPQFYATDQAWDDMSVFKDISQAKQPIKRNRILFFGLHTNAMRASAPCKGEMDKGLVMKSLSHVIIEMGCAFVLCLIKRQKISTVGNQGCKYNSWYTRAVSVTCKTPQCDCVVRYIKDGEHPSSCQLIKTLPKSSS